MPTPTTSLSSCAIPLAPPRVAATFAAFGRAAALFLKPSKRVAVPLWRTPDGALPVEACASMLAAANPAWGDMSVAGCSKYLGAWVGPSADLDRIWREPIAKAHDRATQIADAGVAPGVGLPLLAQRVLPVLSYTAALVVALAALRHVSRLRPD